MNGLGPNILQCAGDNVQLKTRSTRRLRPLGTGFHATGSGLSRSLHSFKDCLGLGRTVSGIGPRPGAESLLSRKGHNVWVMKKIQKLEGESKAVVSYMKNVMWDTQALQKDIDVLRSRLGPRMTVGYPIVYIQRLTVHRKVGALTAKHRKAAHERSAQ